MDSSLPVEMTSVPGDDQWLGRLNHFPIILHSRSSFSIDIRSSLFQKALFAALCSLQASIIPIELTIADREGYARGRISFMIGIGNGEGFDILDSEEEQRLLRRVENQAPFNTIDIVFHLRYTLDDRHNHKLHQDHYVMRFVFQPGTFEVLVHHSKGMRRVEPGELVKLVVEKLNDKLGGENLSWPNLDAVGST